MKNLVYFTNLNGDHDWEILPHDYLQQIEVDPENPCYECIVKMICNQWSNCQIRTDFLLKKYKKWRTMKK
jgi:hypothetical protein